MTRAYPRDVRTALLPVLLLLLARPASAESETANTFDMLGWDPAGKQLYLRDCQSDSGPWDLWAVDFKDAAKPHIEIKPLDKKDDVPKGLKVVKSVQLDDVKLEGLIRKEQLERSENKLVKRFDLRIILEWKSARTVSDFISYRSPEMQLMDVFEVPDSPCALAIVSWSAHLAGIQKQRALVMCPDDRKKK
jgi:hypothetical protein